MKRISIGSWAYTIGPYADNPVAFETVCKTLADLGFDGVELGAFPPHPNPEDHPSADSRKALVASMQEYGLGFSGLAANLWGEQLLNTDDSSSYIANFTANCKFAVDLGIKGVRVDTVQPPTILRETSEEQVFERLVKTWSECIRIADEHGLYVTWEFEPGFCFNTPSQIDRVLAALPQSNFGVLYDTSHGHMCAVVGARHEGGKEILAGGQIELIERLSGRINHIHLIDSDNSCHKDENGDDETSMHLPFGEGVVDFDPIVERLGKEKLDHDWWTIDLCFWPDAWDATAHCKKVIDDLATRFG
ncbi:MAG: sugar phosphate isomerase/epimerase [Planctomycetota bacterium]|jgi:sugar phosphate isomerase/epimerase